MNEIIIRAIRAAACDESSSPHHGHGRGGKPLAEEDALDDDGARRHEQLTHLVEAHRVVPEAQILESHVVTSAAASFCASKGTF